MSEMAHGAQALKASELARHAASILRRRGADGRLVEALSVEGFLDGLFADNPCPQVDRFAFFSTPDGERWLYVEREGVGRKINYIVATGDMGGAKDAISITGLGIVVEKPLESGAGVSRTYDDGALFIDLLGRPQGTLSIDCRIEEAEFVSHTRPNLWKTAFRFDSGVLPPGFENTEPLEAVPAEDEDEDEGDDEGEDAPPSDTQAPEPDAFMPAVVAAQD